MRRSETCAREGKLIRHLAYALMTLLLLPMTAASRADIVDDLYAAEVAVADQGAQALVSASQDALADVLVKVSGSGQVLENGLIRTELGSARKQVQKYAYRRGKDDELYARFEFDSSYVTDLVIRAGEPLWTANRPPVLLWLVLEDAAGRQFVSRETSPELADELAAEFSRRGVPLQFPLHDLADAAALSTDEAWQLSGTAVLVASERYHVQDVLVGRMSQLSSGRWIGDWSYLYGRDRSDRSYTVDDSRMFAREGASLVAESMAGRYAVAPTATEGAGVTMLVTGIERYTDYAAIVSWLEELELVEHANVERVSGNEILLRLHAQADAVQLASLIELNRKLQPLPPGVYEAELNYQWLN
jgi:hypothetical protein